MDALTDVTGSTGGTGNPGGRMASSPMIPAVYRPRLRRLEDRVLLSATPVATVVDLPDEELINDSFQFGVTFDNVGADPQGTGYGPFVDLTVGPGIDIQNVTYLGASVTTNTVGTWDGSNWIDPSGNVITEHPLDPSLALPAGTEEGQSWVNVLVPFGSFTPDQPAARLDITATVAESSDGVEPGAEVGTPIDVTASGGFRFGLDALDNPSTDAPIQQDTPSTDDLTPIVMRLDKEVQLPESETAQGPNFQFTYTISVDVATGATVTDVNIQDILPDNLFFVTATTNISPTLQVAPGVGPTPDGIPGLDTVTTARWEFANVVGRAGDGDIVITLTAYAPETNAAGVEIIDPDNPTTAIATNDATVEADYNGNPVDASTGGDLEDSVDINIRPYTVLKSYSVEGGGAAIPGKYLRFEVDIDISDYQGFQNVVIGDVLSDGLTLDTTDNATLDHIPVLRVERDGQVFFIDLSSTPPPGDETELTAAFAANDTQQLSFFISAALRNNGYDDELLGDLFGSDTVQEGATRMTLVYFARIDENFRNPAQGPVVSNDTLSNAVTMGADSATSGNPSQTDGSDTELEINAPQPQKTVYAVNGVVGAPTSIAPGDEVTYRIRVVLSSNDVDNLRITDFLPQPIYDVDANGTGFSFVDSQTGLPVAFTIIRGPDDTVSGAAGVAGVPGVTTNGANNSIAIDFADFDEVGSQGGVLDLLYTVQVTDQPFADGLLLVNAAQIQTGNSVVEVANEQDFVGEVVLRQPVLSLTKGVVATDADGAVDNSLAFDPTTTGPGKMNFQVGVPGFITSSPVTSNDLAASPIGSDLSGFDAGDTVKFAIVVENTGGQDAFDVVVRDVLPPGFEIPPGAVLTVSYGDGTPVSFTGDINDLFSAGGITINDGNGTGSIAAGEAVDGHNIIIVSYELVVADDFDPRVTVDNEAELVSYSAIEGGTDFTEGVDGQFVDEVELTSQGVTIAKRLVDTDQDFTVGNDMTIGEVGTFQLEVTIPDGDTPATVTDTLPQGMVLVGSPLLRLTFVNAAGDTVTFEGTVQQGGVTLADGTVLGFTQTGNTITFDFSNLIANAAAGTDLAGQTFVIEYQAMASDDPALTSGDTVSNSATLDTPTTGPTGPVSAPIDIVEPNLTVTKTFLPDTAEAGQTVGMRISVQNGSGPFDSTSFGLLLTDDDLDLSTAVFSNVALLSLTGTGGVGSQIAIPGTLTVNVAQVGGQWQITVTGIPDFAIAPGERLDLIFSVTIAPDVEAGTVVENTATIVDDGYSSLPGIDDDERLYGPEEGTDTLTIATPTITKTIVNTSYGGTEQLSFGDPDYRADPDSDVLVGEIVTYELNVRIPRGVSSNVVVYDDTDFVTAAGTVGIMNIVGVDSIVVGGALIPAEQIVQILDPDGDGVANRLQIDFGSITNGASGAVNVGAESIVITFRTQILDVPATNDGDVHTNGTAVTFTTDGVPEFNAADTFPTVTIQEPNIDVVKTATTPDSTTDAGDIVTYRLTLNHTGTSSADGFDLQLRDQLPPGMELIPGSVVINAGSSVFGLDPLQPGDVTLDVANGTVTASGFDLGLGQTITITYQARVADNVVSGQTLTNQVNLTYESLPESDPVDDVDPSVAEPGAIVADVNEGTSGTSETREYSDTAQSTVTIALPGPITKVTDKTSYTIGEQVLYTIRIPVIEGQTVSPTLTDFLPVGQDFIEGSGSVVAADGTVITGTFTQVGQSLILDGDTFQTVADNNANNDFILVTFAARIQNVAANNNGDIETNRVTVTSEGQPDRTATANIRIVEPDIVITKSNNAPATVDAGDVVTFTVKATHTAQSTSNAYEFSFTDNLPADMGPVALVSATVNGVDVRDQLSFDPVSGILTGTDIDIPLGATFTLVYQLVVLDSAGPNETITNTASGSWSSLNGDIDGERTGIGGDPVNDYLDEVQDSIRTSDQLDVVKSVVGPDRTFAVGETVDYNLDITVMEGTLRNVVVADVIAPGLEIDMSSLRIVGSGFAGGSVSIVNVTQTVNAAGFTVITFLLDNDPGTPGSQIVNPGDPIGDATPNDTIRIAYSTVVTNEFVNQDGHFLVNVAGVQAEEVSLATGAEIIEVVEPEVSIDKTIVSPAGPVDAGDVIQYQVVLTNTGTSTAFDVTFFDLAPPDTRFTGTVTAVDGSGVTVGTFVIGPGGLRLDGSGFDIAVGASITLTYSVTVQATIAPGDTITNGATVRWTSTSGANPDERTGNDGAGPDDTVLNNYEASDTTTIGTDFADLSVTKQLITTSVGNDASTRVVVGETATYQIGLTLGEGTTPGVVLTDVLTDGLRFVPGSLQVIAPPGTLFDGQATLDPSDIIYDPVTDTLTIRLGAVTLPGGDNSLPGQPDTGLIRFVYRAVVTNQFSNQQDTDLSNTITATSTSPDIAGDTDGPITITVDEPDITIDKQLVSTPPPADAGDVARYQVVLVNNGTSTAYDVTFADLAPQDTIFTGPVTAVDGSGAPIGSFVILGNGARISGTGFDIPVGGSVTITYSLVVQDSFTSDQLIINTADVRWTSTPGGNLDERTGADGPGPDGLVLNNYADRDSVVPPRSNFDLVVGKELFDSSLAQTSGSELAVGETATFRLRVVLSEGTTENLVLSDFLPEGQRFIPGSIVVAFGAPGMTTTLNPENAFVLPGTNTLVIRFGDVVNPGDNIVLNNFIDVFYQVVVEDVPEVFDGASLSNTVVAIADRLVEDTDSAEVTVVEPDLLITKTADAPIVAIGEAVGYQISVQHSGASNVSAFDLVIADPFNDPFMVLDKSTLTARIEGMPGAVAPIIQFVGNGFRVIVPELALGARVIIEFDATAQSAAGANGAASTNTTTLTYDTIPDVGTPDEQRDYRETDDATVTIAGPDLRVIKDASQFRVEPGEMFNYTVQVLNKGAPGIDAGSIEQARNVVLTDTLPDDVELLAVTVDGVNVPFTVDPATGEFSIRLGTLDPEQTVIVRMTVQLADVLSPVTEAGGRELLLVNRATATLDQPDPTPQDNTDTAVIEPFVDGRAPAPDLVVTKTNSVEEIGGKETVAFTITARNAGERVAAGVQVVDRIDMRVFEFVSASDGGVFDPRTGTVTWRLNTLSPDDGERDFTLVLRVRPGLSPSVDDTTNIVRISDNGLGGRDPTPQNNVDTHTDRLIYPDLVITKSNGVDEVSPGDVVDYVITVSNVGDYQADGVVVRDVIDLRVFRFVSATNGGVFDPVTGTVTWRLGTMGADGRPITLGLTLEVLFPPPDIDEAVNVIEVNGDGTRGRDADPTNNVATDRDILNAAPDPIEIRRVLGEDEEEEEEEIEEPLYLSPIFTGRSPVSSTVTVTLIGADGSPIDMGSVVAGPDGNWTLLMRDVEGPAPVSAIVMTSPSALTPLGVLDHTNVFFNPGGNTPIDFRRDFDIYSARDLDSDAVLAARMAASEDPLAVTSRRYMNFNEVTGTAISSF